MSLVSENSPVTAIPEFDFYSNTPVQTSIEKTYIEQIRPINQLNTGGHIEFLINNGLNEYVKLKETTLFVSFRVKLAKSDGSAVATADWTKVSVVNNLLHSLWSQIDLTIGDSQTTLALQTYPYRAYFETILGSTEWSRNSHLQSGLFCLDKFGTDTNNPHADRMKYINNKAADTTTPTNTGRICEIEGKLHLDMFFQHRALVGGTKMKLKLVPNRPEFYFMTSDDKLIPKLFFEDIHLNIMKCKASEEIIMAHIQALNVNPVKYILNRAEVRSFTIDKGASSRSLENVINGQLPRRVYLAFVSNEAYSGSLTKNPYFFHHYHINSISCFINGEQFPRKAYTPDFDNDKYMREFIELFRVSEQLDNDARMVVNRDNYKAGYSMFAFNLSPDLSQGYNSAGYVNVPKEGVLRFEIHFSQALDTIVNALIYCEFDNLLSIGQDRNAFTDYR